MIWRTSRETFLAALGAALVMLAGTNARGVTIDSSILLGPSNGAGNVGNFSGTLSLGSGSQLQLGSNAISGNYQQHLVFFNSNIGFSAQNQTANLTLNPSSISMSTNNSSGTADLSYDNVAPGSPQTLNSFNANLSDGAVANVQINSSAIAMSTSLGTFNLTPQFNGTLSGISFASSQGVDVSGGGSLIPGTFSAVINGSVTGSLSVAGLFNIGLGTLYQFPTNTVVTFDGALPSAVVLSDTGVPFPGAETNTDKNNLLADFNAALGNMQIPFAFSAALNTNQNFSVGGSSSGVTSIKIQNTTLVANLVLSGLSFDLSGQAPNVLVPEPSTFTLIGVALVGFVAVLARRKAR